MGQTGLMEYKKKNGNQHAMKLPMMRPRMRVARRSFFLASLFFSFSASCSGVSLGAPGLLLAFIVLPASTEITELVPQALLARPVLLPSLFFRRIPLSGPDFCFGAERGSSS